PRDLRRHSPALEGGENTLVALCGGRPVGLHALALELGGVDRGPRDLAQTQGLAVVVHVGVGDQDAPHLLEGVAIFLESLPQRFEGGRRFHPGVDQGELTAAGRVLNHIGVDVPHREGGGSRDAHHPSEAVLIGVADGAAGRPGLRHRIPSTGDPTPPPTADPPARGRGSGSSTALRTPIAPKGAPHGAFEDRCAFSVSRWAPIPSPAAASGSTNGWSPSGRAESRSRSGPGPVDAISSLATGSVRFRVLFGPLGPRFSSAAYASAGCGISGTRGATTFSCSRRRPSRSGCSASFPIS